MNAIHELHRMGVEASLSPGGKIHLAGLNRLGRDEAARVVAIAKEHRDDIVIELRDIASSYATIKHSVEQGLLRVIRHPDGMLIPDLSDVESRFGFEARRVASEWWNMALPEVYANEDELLRLARRAGAWARRGRR